MPPIVYELATLAVFFCIYNIMTWGLNIQFGGAGILNFTFITFMAAGAYVAGVFSIGPQQPGTGVTYILGLSWVFPLPQIMGGLAAAALGFLVGLVALRRLRSDYLAIVTLAVGSIAYTLVGSYTPLFSGWDGLVGVPSPLNNWLNLDPLTYQIFYVGVCFVIMLVFWFFAHRLMSSPLGRAMRAVRDDADVAEAYGKDTYRIRMVAMVLGCAYAGVAGALLIGFTGAISPAGWTAPETFVLWAVLLIGGRGNLVGTMLGCALIIVLFSEGTRFLPTGFLTPNLVATLRNIIIGALLIIVLRIRPAGVLPEIRRRFADLRSVPAEDAVRV
jgi:ABC-type branched-subunit amino acid transport system permease subunit